MDSLEDRLLFSHTFVTVLTNTTGTAIYNGPDSNIWYINSSSQIVKLSDGVPYAYTVPNGAVPVKLVDDGDDLWFNVANQDEIGSIDTNGTITLYATPAPAVDLTVGADANIWFLTSTGVDSMTTSGVVTTNDIPSADLAKGTPTLIAANVDGNKYFTLGSSTLMRLDSDGTFFAVGTRGLPRGSQFQTLITGPTGSVWFGGTSTSDGGVIGHTTHRGRLLTYKFKRNAHPSSITDLADGSDGYIFFPGSKGIDRINDAGQETTIPFSDNSNALEIAGSANDTYYYFNSNSDLVMLTIT